MPVLTITRGVQTQVVSFDAPAKLSAVLEQAGLALPHPCGGKGTCGKCAVMLSGHVSAPSSTEERVETRLSCQAVLLGDAAVYLPVQQEMAQIAASSGQALSLAQPMPGRCGAAIDIGTTTLAAAVYDLHTGACIGSATMANPQRTVAADVIGRIDAAMKGQGEVLRRRIQVALRTLLVRAGGSDASSLVITGNTTMLYLLTGRDPACLGRAPFAADHLFGAAVDHMGRDIFLPPCLHAFIGADTTCALLASGLMHSSATALLCDVGTNGEMALWHQGTLYIASTAAGPAFEGAGIRHGCVSVPGAIDRCEVVDGHLVCRTIGNAPATGICGSGLVDAIAGLLQLGVIDETGCMEEDEYPLRDGIVLTQADVRTMQLAKAAIHAGMLRLLSAAGITADDVHAVYLAGGFGLHLDIGHAAQIGLIPEALAGRVRIIGNAALDGAAMLLADMGHRAVLRSMQSNARHIRLDGDAQFTSLYVDAMLFGE